MKTVKPTRINNAKRIIKSNVSNCEICRNVHSKQCIVCKGSFCGQHRCEHKE